MTTLDPQIQIASTGIFGLGLQATKGVPRTQNELFDYYPLTSGGYGLNQGMANLPPEMGKSTTPRGSYKTGISGDGQVTMIPRLVDKFGKMMLILMGKDAVTADTTLDGVAVSGVHVHTFTFDDNEVFLPYASGRRVIPGPRKLAEVTQDIRLGRGEFNFPAVGPMSASLQMAGRVPNAANMFVNDPDIPMELASIAYESDDSFANGIDPDSTITIMGESLKCTGLSVSIMNELAPGDQTRHVGGQTPFDYPVLSRTISVRATVFFTDKDLYQRILAGVSDATTWESSPLAGNVNFMIYSPDIITGSIKRGIQFRTTQGNVKWGLDGVMALQPRQMMMLNLVGTVVRPASGVYFEVRMQNGISTPYTQYKVAPYKFVQGVITTATSGTKTFVGTGLLGIRAGDLVQISRMSDAGNNGVFTAASDSTATDLVVVESVTTAATQTGVATCQTSTKNAIVTSFTAPATITGTGFVTAGLEVGDLIVVTGAPDVSNPALQSTVNNGYFTINTVDATTITTVEQTIVTDASLAPAGSVTSFTALTKTLVGTGFTGLKPGDQILIASSEDTANNKMLTIATVISATSVTVEETVVDTAAAPDVATFTARNVFLVA